MSAAGIVETPSVSTDHLNVLECGGSVDVVSLDGAYLFDWVSCGRISAAGDDRCYWPADRLGEEPEWFWSEVETLCELIASIREADARDAANYYTQVCHDYDSSRGLN